MTSQPAPLVAPTDPSSPVADHPTVLPVVAPVGPTTSPGLPDTRPARSRTQGKQKVLLLYLALGGLAVAGIGAAYVIIEKPFNKTRTDLVTYTVKRGRLELKIVERGTLEAASNADVTCEV